MPGGGWSLTKELGGWDEVTLPSAHQFGDARENDVGTLDNALRGVVRRGLLLAVQGIDWFQFGTSSCLVL